MSFDKGTVNFTVLEPAKKFDAQVVDEIINDSYRDEAPMIDTSINDVTSGISLADIDGRDPVREDFLKSNIPFFALRTRSLQIDSSLIKERLERILADYSERGIPITGKLKKEAKENLKELAAKDAKLKISGIRCTVSPANGRVYTEATTEKKVDEVLELLMSIIPIDKTGGRLSAVTPEHMAHAAGFNPENYEPVKISEHESVMGLGEDFLTYLFMASEVRDFHEGVEISLPGNIEMVDCRSHSPGAKNISMKDGIASISKEAISCLKTGKKVKSADFSFGFNDVCYTVTIDSEFHFKKMKFENAESEGDDGAGFQGRVFAMDNFMKWFDMLFRKFLSTADRNGYVMRKWLEEKEKSTTQV
jgi:hypothetical protein